MPGPFLYSAMPWMKFHIYSHFLKDSHYVWCSYFFDARKAMPWSLHAKMAPSSNPAEIYEQLKAATVTRPDRHNDAITRWQGSLTALALKWKDAGTISDAAQQEITYLVNQTEITNWRPLLYVINRTAVEGRMSLVPPQDRASPAEEFIVPDLTPLEFDVLEF